MSTKATPRKPRRMWAPTFTKETDFIHLQKTKRSARLFGSVAPTPVLVLPLDAGSKAALREKAKKAVENQYAGAIRMTEQTIADAVLAAIGITGKAE